jgi:reactive intermediate/imine deaminase
MTVRRALMKPAITIALGLALALFQPAMAQDRLAIERIGEPTLNGQRLPFSSVVRAGDTFYLSGALGIGPDGKLANGMEAQAKLAMDNLGAALKSAGLGWGDVVKCTVMLDNMADWPAFNKVYVTYFPDKKFPARSAFGADGLALGALVEVECIAYAGAQ